MANRILLALILAVTCCTISPTISLNAPAATTVSPVYSSIVQILGVKDGKPIGGGSGFAVSPDRIITAKHVCEGIQSNHLALVVNRYEPDGETIASVPGARIVRTSKTDDLCLIEARHHGLKPLEIATHITIHEHVLAVGCPLALMAAEYPGVLMVRDGDLLLSSNLTAHGMSGACVVNAANQVVGVVVMVPADFPGVSFLVSSDRLTRFLSGK